MLTFSEIIRQRPGDKAKIVSILNSVRGVMGDSISDDLQRSQSTILLDDLDKDLFVLKFLLVGSRGLHSTLLKLNNPSS